MNIGDPIEAESVKLWRTVYGHTGMSMEMARSHFWCQNESVIKGWNKLAKSLNRITTPATIEHVANNER